MAKVRIDISYDGTHFSGWQRQAGEERTVQASLEKALQKLFKEDIKTFGSGRTDAGVHANQQVVHFRTDKDLEKFNIQRALNGFLPKDISVNRVFIAPEEFEALFSANHKDYVYKIWYGPHRNSMFHRYQTHVWKEPNIEVLNQCAKILIGEHDFKSFQSAGTIVNSTVRQITKSEWIDLGNQHYEYHVSGNGFLKQMVRNIVGTQLELQHLDFAKEKMKEILEATDRKKAGKTAPPNGLVLNKVYYPDSLIFKEIIFSNSF